MAAITPQSASVNGTDLTFSSTAGGGDTVDNSSGKTLLILKNANAASRTVAVTAVTTTRPASGSFPAQTVSNLSVVVPAGGTTVIGPIPAAYNTTAGLLQLTYSATTDLTIAAITTP